MKSDRIPACLQTTLFRAPLVALVVFCAAGSTATRSVQEIPEEIHRTAVPDGRQSRAGTIALRVLVVIPDAVRAYKVRNRLAFARFGQDLANQTEKLFTKKFAATKLLPTLPPGPFKAEGVDLVVILEVPRGEYHGNGQIALSAGFEVRDPKGEEIFHAQEEADGKISDDGTEQLGGAVVREFLEELILNERVQAMLAPKPAVDAPSPILESAGLDEPPPPPWAHGIPPADQDPRR